MYLLAASLKQVLRGSYVWSPFIASRPRSGLYSIVRTVAKPSLTHPLVTLKTMRQAMREALVEWPLRAFLPLV